MNHSSWDPGRAGALILDAHLKSALAVIRSLGSRGVPIVAGSSRSTAMGLYSRYVNEAFVYPSPLNSKIQFVESIVQRVLQYNRPLVLYAFSDASFLSLYEQRDRWGDLICVCPPSPENVAIAYDKSATLDLALNLGLEIPSTHVLESVKELELFDWTCGCPVVLKPKRSITWRKDRAVHQTPSFAFSKEDARLCCDRILNSTGDLPLLQEYIHGEELGAEFLCEEGQVVAAFSHKRIRSLSPSGGASVVKEAIEPNYKRIGDFGRQLAKALEWTGPMMVEFKVDRRDGRPKLMEINGRFWGSLPLAVFAGVDFPWLYYLMATGRDLPHSVSYREGLISRHWLGDLMHLCRVLVGRDPMRAHVYPNRNTALRDFFLTSHHFKSDVTSGNDLKPALAELFDWMSRVFIRATTTARN